MSEECDLARRAATSCSRSSDVISAGWIVSDMVASGMSGGKERCASTIYLPEAAAKCDIQMGKWAECQRQKSSHLRAELFKKMLDGG